MSGRAMGDEIAVRRTLDRLQREELDRHDAIHAVDSVLVKHLHRPLQDARPVVDPNQEFWTELEQITAEGWRNAD
jgi:hypothetical protein